MAKKKLNLLKQFEFGCDKCRSPYIYFKGLPKKEYSGIFRALRRVFYYKFKRKYIIENLKKRKGKCKRCGCCSTKIFSCKYFDTKSKECIIWKLEGYDSIPFHCQAYPFDEKDKTSFAKLNCGFYWE